MKILKISDVYFPRINGVSTSIQTLWQELHARGHQVTLVAPEYPAGQNANGVVRIDSRRVVNDPEDRWMRGRAIDRLVPRLRAEQFDLVHVHTPFVAHRKGVALGHRLGVPVVETYHTLFEEYLHHYVPLVPRPFLRWLARRVSRAQCDRVAAVVAPSQAMHDTLRRYGVTTPVEVIPTGIQVGGWQGGDGLRFRRRFGIAPTRPTLVHVGRIAFEKNVLFLLDVLAEVRSRLPEVLLVVAGEGPALPRLWERARALHLERNLLLVGYLDRATELADCYRAGDLFVFASRTETQGLVLLEAMALGVPVVSIAAMGTLDILRDGEGARVAPDSIPDFAGLVVELLRDHDQRHALGHAARRYAARWGSDAMVERMLSLYSSLRQRPVRAGDGA